MKTTNTIIGDLSSHGFTARATSDSFRHGYTNGAMDAGRGTIAIYDDGARGWYAVDTVDAALLASRLEDAEDEAERYDAYSEWCSVCGSISCTEDALV